MSDAAKKILDSIVNSPTLLESIDNALSRPFQNQRESTSQPSSTVSEVRTLFNMSRSGQNNAMTTVLSRPAFDFSRNFCGSASRGAVNMRRTRKRMSCDSPFLRDVCLLPSANDFTVPRGCRRTVLAEEGYIISAMQFQKQWSAQEVLQLLRTAFHAKLKENTELNIMMGYHTKLVRPVLEVGGSLDGFVLCKLFKDKTIYLQPSCDLMNNDKVTNEETFGEEPADFCLEEAETVCLSDCEEPPAEPFTSASVAPISAAVTHCGAVASTSASDVNEESSSRSLIDNREWQYATLFESEDDSDAERTLSITLEDHSHEQNGPPPLQERDIAEILEKLAEQIDRTPDCRASYFNISRKHVWESAKQSFSLKSFSPSRRIDVKFMDDFGTSEGAADVGGPRREFLTLLMESLQQGGIFVGPEHAKFLNFTSRSMQTDDYFHAGVAVAMSMVHGGPGPQFISPSLFKALTTTPETTAISIEEVTDPELCVNLERLVSGDYGVLHDLETILDMAGTFAIVQGQHTARKVALETAHWYCLGRNRAAFERFKEGLKTLGVLEAMESNPDAFFKVMCHQPHTFSYISFSALMREDLHPPGSSKRSTENLVLSFWRTFLIEVEDESTELSFPDILFFSTGCRTLPPLGLRPHPTLSFLHYPEEDGKLSRFPKANACSNNLCIPTVHTNYADFKSDMLYGILNCQGFGFI